jgi:type IV fimbrial biogenesis protein FimT
MRGAISRRAGGFTLIEALVVVAIIGVMLGVGLPGLSNWLAAGKAASAGAFYAEGFGRARAEAISHNSASRLVFNPNAANGQYDWQVDICYPQPGTPCNAISGSWSTTAAAAEYDLQGTNGFRSVSRSAAGLPDSAVLKRTISPSGATSVYFTSTGWVDQNVAPAVQRIDLEPVKAGAFPQSAIVLTLAGMAIKCDPGVTGKDARRCPQ